MQRYEVTAPSRVLGHEPGTEFEADIPDAQEKRLLGRGALRRVDTDAATVDPLPEGVTDLGDDLFELPDGAVVEGRDAVHEALTAPANPNAADSGTDPE